MRIRPRNRLKVLILCALYLISTIQLSWAESSKLLAIDIAMQMTPFFSFENGNSTGVFCLITNDPPSKGEQENMISKASKISPPLKFEILQNPKESGRCQYIYIDYSDALFFEKSMPFVNKKSLLIGTSEDLLYANGHVALIRVATRFTININKKNMLKSGIRPSSQILNLSKILIE